MKKLICAATFSLLLAGCHRDYSPATGLLPVQSVTPIPRPAMDKRLAMLFPGAQVEKLAPASEGEFFDIKKKGKPTARAALVMLKDAKGKEVQLLVVMQPDGKIKIIATGLRDSAGQTKEIYALNTFLRGFIGKDGAALQKYSAPADVDKVTSKNAVEALKTALAALKTAKL